MFGTTKKLAAAGFALLGLMLAVSYANAASPDPALQASIHQIQADWAKIKFTMVPSDKQLELMNNLGKQADALAAQYPDQPDALIWDGIILSERASMSNERNSLTGGLTALGLAKQAKAVLEKAYAIDPAALDAGAATTLGVLYYRVPGFPLGFGDSDKARQLLEEAVRTAPDSLDAEYFYGDYLYSNKQLPQATVVLQKALTIPPNTDRPIWDHNRRLVIQQLLGKIQAKG